MNNKTDIYFPTGRVLRTTLAGLIAVLVAILFTAMDFLGRAALWENVHWTIATWTMAYLGYLGWHSTDGNLRRIRGIMTVGLIAYAIGQILWDIQWALGYVEFPAASDLFYLSIAPFLGLGIVLTFQGRISRGDAFVLNLDGSIIFVGIATTIFTFYGPRSASLTPLATTVLVAYPVIFLALGGAVLVGALATRSQLTLRNSPYLLLLGLAFSGACWVVWNSLALDQVIPPGSMVGYGFSLSHIVVGLGVATWGNVPSTDPRLNRWAKLSLSMLPVVVIPLTVLLIESPSAKTAALEILIRAGGIIVIFLAVLRQSVLLWERDRLLMRERDLLEDAENEIAERKRVQEERENLITELTNKNAELEVFIYTVSHDLKSPLVTIRGFLGFLEQDAVAGNIERHKINARRIANAVDKMRELLSDLLELSRVGRFINKLEKIQFEDLARVAIELVEGRLLAGNVTVEIQPGLPTVYGDRKRLVEVLQNLIDNAAKYMGGQPQPRIEIGYNGEENGSLHFYVRDNGIGIAQEYHERIFGLFEKLDAQSEGTGIGLTLVKRIVEFHGGRIWVESEPQKESTFFFTLPSQPIPDSVI